MPGSQILKTAALTLTSFLLAFGLLLIIEFLVRLTSDIGRLGTRADLFVNEAFGESIGNTPNVKTIAFGVEVYADEAGFRTDPNRTASATRGRGALLILGDSVGFGVGVEFEQTVAAKLASAFPEFDMYNTSVIGYGVNDYRNVSSVVLPRYADSIKHVLVIFCLNDVSVVSAGRIRNAIGQTPAHPTMFSAGIDIQSLKEISFVSSVNSYLRARSSLYVWIRGGLTDPQTRYWQSELANYRKLSDETIAGILDPLDHIARTYDDAGIAFTVFILPFAGQAERGESSLPQRKLRTFFENKGMDYVDLLPRFRQGSRPKDLFLPYDPMHLSPAGHEVLFQVIRDHVRKTQSGSP